MEASFWETDMSFHWKENQVFGPRVLIVSTIDVKQTHHYLKQLKKQHNLEPSGLAGQAARQDILMFLRKPKLVGQKCWFSLGALKVSQNLRQRHMSLFHKHQKTNIWDPLALPARLPGCQARDTVRPGMLIVMRNVQQFASSKTSKINESLCPKSDWTQWNINISETLWPCRPGCQARNIDYPKEHRVCRPEVLICIGKTQEYLKNKFEQW